MKTAEKLDLPYCVQCSIMLLKVAIYVCCSQKGI